SISKAIRHRKNNTLRLLPGGGALSTAHRFFWRVTAPATRNTNPKPNKTPTPRNIKKLLGLSHCNIKKLSLPPIKLIVYLGGGRII
ncbi:hypothetical protein ACVGWR_06980, partial [Enterobacter hormaechei]